MVGSCPALGGSADRRGTSRQRRIYPDGVSTSRQIPSQGIDLSDFISYPFTRGDSVWPVTMLITVEIRIALSASGLIIVTGQFITLPPLMGWISEMHNNILIKKCWIFCYGHFELQAKTAAALTSWWNSSVWLCKWMFIDWPLQWALWTHAVRYQQLRHNAALTSSTASLSSFSFIISTSERSYYVIDQLNSGREGGRALTDRTGTHGNTFLLYPYKQLSRGSQKSSL